MLKMQDKASGGVYHKVTTRSFPDITAMPDKDVDDLLVMPVSTTATADFAAVTALAARIYKDFDVSFSDKCLLASEQAWGWLEENKDFVPFENPQDVVTGEYGDSSGLDEISWAAAELFRTTGNKEYSDYFVKHYESNGFGLGWQNVSGFAAIAYLFTGSEETDMQKAEEIRKSWLEKADMFVSTAQKDGFLVAMHKMEYNWGSNMNVANHAFHLLVAEKLNNDEKYTEVAESSSHYLLGRNSLNQSYITGFGSKQVLQPHHRPSAGDTVKAPIPGLVVGGPNSALDDEIAKAKLTGLAPAKCYIDDMTSYSTNEVATYWNSPGIFIFGYLNSAR
jgi:endoglucanase